MLHDIETAIELLRVASHRRGGHDDNGGIGGCYAEAYDGLMSSHAMLAQFTHNHHNEDYGTRLARSVNRRHASHTRYYVI